MKFVIGHSDDVDARDAVEAAIRSCLSDLEGERPKAALLFASVEYDHQVLLDRIAEEWPDIPVVGGSSDGELSSACGFCHDSVLLTLFAGDDLEARAGVGRDLSRDLEQAVAEAADCLGDASPFIAITTFAPSTNSSAVVRALSERHALRERGVERSLPVVGGLTGDHREFARTTEFFGREVLRDAFSVLYLSGDACCGWGLGSGWTPIGTAFEVTASEGHVVREINGLPALATYQRHYGAVSSGSLGEYPLAVSLGADETSWSLRAVMGSDAASGTLTFAGEVPVGSRVRMTEVLAEGILSGSAHSLESALQAYAGNRPELALVFSCAARKWVLGTQASQEIEQLRACAAENGVPDLRIAGFYCFGEIAPVAGGAAPAFHNETCVSLVLGQ